MPYWRRRLPPDRHSALFWSMFGSGLICRNKTGRDRLSSGQCTGATTMLPLAGLLIFCGAVGKSAQFLNSMLWLPDASKGGQRPTPWSAPAIHAATMVAAGVGMLCRVYFLLGAQRRVTGDRAWAGGFTKRVHCCCHCRLKTTSNVIPRLLHYRHNWRQQAGGGPSAWAAPAAAMFHLTTHAFFKALLFLGAGSAYPCPGITSRTSGRWAR